MTDPRREAIRFRLDEIRDEYVRREDTGDEACWADVGHLLATCDALQQELDKGCPDGSFCGCRLASRHEWMAAGAEHKAKLAEAESQIQRLSEALRVSETERYAICQLVDDYIRHFRGYGYDVSIVAVRDILSQLRRVSALRRAGGDQETEP